MNKSMMSKVMVIGAALAGLGGHFNVLGAPHIRSLGAPARKPKKQTDADRAALAAAEAKRARRAAKLGGRA